MQSLKKVTSEFIETEDRFRLSALTTENEAVAFWLTQRLLTRLVAHLSKQIEIDSPQLSHAPVDKKTDNSDSDRNTPIDKKTDNSDSDRYGQTSNRESSPEQSAVKIEKNIKPILITEVDIKFGKSDLTLVLKSGKKSWASISFSLTELKQWLEILYSLWHRASWPISLWPQKLIDNSSIKEVSTNTIH